jgi:phage terminase large subunit
LESGKVDTVICAAHRRWGKDEIALNWTAVAAMQRVGSYLYCLPQYSQARKAIWAGVNARTGRTRVEDAFPDEIIKSKDDKGMFLKLKNNSTVQLVGSDAHDGLVGGGVVGLVMSEAALSDPAAYSFLRPMLAETRGWSIHISSPRGKNHFHKLMETHKNRAKSFTTNLSAYDTDVFTPEQLKEEKHNYLSEHGVAMGTALFNQEYLCSFDAAIIGGVWTAELAQLKADGRYGICNYDPRYAVDTSCDIGVSDLTVFCFWQTVGTEVRLIDVYANNDTGLEHYTKMLAEKPYYYGTHYGPHDIENREFGSGTSRKEQAARLGLKWVKVSAIPKTDQIALGSQLMKRLVINNALDLDSGAPVCEYAIEALSQYHWKYDEVRKISSSTPVHDWSSHFCDAYMLYAVAKAKDTGFSLTPETKIKYQEKQYPRLGAIMARNNNRPAGLWG